MRRMGAPSTHTVHNGPSMGDIWTNWAREQVCSPAAIERPGSEAELAGIVAAAAQRGQTVRAVGSGHSFSDCACTDGVMIDMSGMPRVLRFDASTGCVTVEGGIKLYALGAELARCGVALENQGDIDRQSVTGAASTATHGTGVRLQNLSARIVGIRLVTASGEVMELSEESDDRDAYLAARVSIGALGVISAVQIQCVPLYTLHRCDQPAPLADTLARLEEHVSSNDHFEFFVFPYTQSALIRRMRRSREVPSPPPRWRRHLQEEIIENRALGAVCHVGRAFPGLTPKLNSLIASAMSVAEVEDHAYKVYATTRSVRFTEMEYAIPRAHAREAVERVLELVARRRLPILFPLEVRFSAADDAFLSTANARDTCYVAVHQYHAMEFETYFRAVERIMDDYAGRPAFGASATTRRRRRCASATRTGTASRRSARGSTLTGSLPTTTPGACSGLSEPRWTADERPRDAERPRRIRRRPRGPRGVRTRPLRAHPIRAAASLRAGVFRAGRAVRLRGSRRDVVQLGRDARPRARQAHPRGVQVAPLPRAHPRGARLGPRIPRTAQLHPPGGPVARGRGLRGPRGCLSQR